MTTVEPFASLEDFRRIATDWANKSGHADSDFKLEHYTAAHPDAKFKAEAFLSDPDCVSVFERIAKSANECVEAPAQFTGEQLMRDSTALDGLLLCHRNNHEDALEQYGHGKGAVYDGENLHTFIACERLNCENCKFNVTTFGFRVARKHDRKRVEAFLYSEKIIDCQLE